MLTVERQPLAQTTEPATTEAEPPTTRLLMIVGGLTLFTLGLFLVAASVSDEG